MAGFAIGALAGASAARRPVVVYHDRPVVVHRHEAVRTVTKVVRDPVPVHQTQTQQTQSTTNTTTSIGNPNIVINVPPAQVLNNAPNNDTNRPVAVLPQEQKPQTSLIETVGQTNANAHASDSCTAYVMAPSTNMSHDDAAKEAATVCNK